jgi:hypothetical protein
MMAHLQRTTTADRLSLGGTQCRRASRGHQANPRTTISYVILPGRTGAFFRQSDNP